MVLRSNAYLLPDENTGHLVYADTRISDPRYARSTEDLVCVTKEFIPNIPGPVKSGGPGVREGYITPEGPQKIPIGCCPQGDPMGKPYSAGMSCCCGTVYDENMQMCCQHSCAVYPNTLSGITKCNLDMIPDTTEDYGTIGLMTTAQPSIPMSNPVHPSPEPETIVWEEEEGKCPRAWYVMSPLTAACTDYNNEGSYCSFSCPAGFSVKIPDDPNRVCHNGMWQGDVPACCERDGCPENMQLDFFFILDSSSSIKKTNFQYVREYVIGLVAALPIGQDLTRIGILTYNNDVIHRIRLNQFDKKSELIQAIKDIPYEGRGTKTNQAIRYAVDEALTEENGNRPGVNTMVLVITDGRATDDVSIDSPRLREIATVVAVGVGKRIKKPELVEIAGDPDQVYMVADFRSLTLSSSNGDSICIDSMLEDAKAEEGLVDAEGNPTAEGIRQIQKRSASQSDAVQADLDSVIEELTELEEMMDKGVIENSYYYVEQRRLLLRKDSLMNTLKELGGKRISGPRKSKQDVEKVCPKPGKGAPGSASQANELLGERFTTAWICPKACVYTEYDLFYVNNALSSPAK
jgi:uncharacterized protein YegL